MSPGTKNGKLGTWAGAVRALRYRNYRLFFGGQSISMIGTWMTRVAMSWLVYRLTGSALLLGVVSFAGQIPTFLFAPFAGVWVDRLNRHHVLVSTQVLAMVQSFILAVFTLRRQITIWDIIWLGAFQGVINAFDMPARQAFVIQMVERADLGNAIALNSSLVNMARLIGPSLSGIIIALVGEGFCFLIDGLSYLAVIASLLAMRLPTVRRPEQPKGQVINELKEGWRYVSRSQAIRSLLLLLALVSLVGMPYSVLMPMFAGGVLHGGPHVLGFLMAASGIGALTGAIRLAMRKSVLGLGRMVAFSAALFGAGLVLFSQSHTLWLSLLLMFVTGFGMMQHMASSNTILQTITEEDKRGRVMSYYTMSFIGMAPFGSLLSGEVAAKAGAPTALLISGICCLMGAAWFGFQLKNIRRQVRPIYIQLGILPESICDVQSSSIFTTPSEN